MKQLSLSAHSTCASAPAGYALLPAHCIGPDPASKTCAKYGHGQLAHGDCAGNLSTCVPLIASWCAANATCRSFAVMASGADCATSPLCASQTAQGGEVAAHGNGPCTGLRRGGASVLCESAGADCASGGVPGGAMAVCPGCRGVKNGSKRAPFT